MINLPFYKVLKMEIPTHIKYWIIKNKQIPKHLLEIIDQTPPITLENTLALPLENFKIHGRTTQKQLSGKNKFGLTAEDFNSGTTVGFAKQVVLTGLTPNTKYTCSTNDSAAIGSATTNLLFGGASTAYNGVNNVTPRTTTSNENGEILVLLRTTNIDSFYDNYWVQVEEGTTPTPYEQYCGGQPSPNPEFPQSINNVSGDITISVTDENNTNSQEVVFPLAEGQKLMEGDYLADDGVHHVREQITITENITSLNPITLAGVSGQYATYRLLNAKSQGSDATNNFKCDRVSYNKGKIVKYGGYTVAKNFVVLTDLEDTVENFNQKIKGSILEYELAQETIEPYTTAQAEAYNNFKNLHGYNNITIVDLASSNLTPNVSLKYYAKG